MTDTNMAGYAAVIPAAGQATRIHGLPKFLLPLWEAEQNLLALLLAKMRRGFTEKVPLAVMVATRPSHCHMLYSSLDTSSHLIAKKTSTMSETVHSLMPLVGSRRVLFGMPDTYFDDQDCFVKLQEALDSGSDVALGVWKMRLDQRGKLGQVAIGPDDEVVDIVDKTEDCPLEWVWGVIAFKTGFWQFIDPMTSHIGYALKPAIDAGLKVTAVRMSGEYYDCGTPSEYLALIRRGQETS